jgi:hypothetical protein
MLIDVSSDELNKIIKIVKNGGGEVFEQDGYINFCGVRNNVTNDTFNDILYIYWKDKTDGTFKCVKTKDFTTKPGKKSVINPINSKGAAIVKEGWHKDIWHHGKHQGKYDALRQTQGVTQPVVITRDNTQRGRKDGKYDLRILSNTTESGFPYTNMHRSGDGQGNGVNGWSAGCQVFKFKSDFDTMLKMAKAASKKGQKKFSYFLTNKTVLDNDGVVDSNKQNEEFNFEQLQFENIINSWLSDYYGGNSQYSNNVSNLGSSNVNQNGLNNQNFESNNQNFEIVESPDSFGNKVIFTKVFPNDDNNKYINMASDDICIIQYSEPSIKVDKLNISEKNYAAMGVNPEKVSYYVPVVFINDFMIPQTNITNFYLDYSSFVPQVMVEFVDITNNMLSTNIPKPGSYIKVLIGGGYGDEKYYKPIRQDFIITNITKTNKTGGEYQNYYNSGNPIKYKLTGILNVPMGFRKMSWCSSSVNARQAIFNISNSIGLGFATNFDINNKVDVMKWVNTQNKSLYDFMREITQHSCYSPYTFFTSFIDQYYVLNYVECHRLLSHGGDKTDNPQMIYSCIMPDMEDKKTETENKDGDLVNNGEQKVEDYFLTNSLEYKGWTNYIEEYYEINDGYSMISDGCRKILTYSDKIGFSDVSSKNYKFLFTPIDNLERDGNRTIKTLPEDIGYNTYIPLNLIQTTSYSYIDNQNIYDDPASTESRVDLGEVDTSNNFPLYFYASIQNDFQMKNLKKCGLSVRLQNYNPSITRYSRIWLDIYDMNRNSMEEIRKKSNVDDMPDSNMKNYFKDKNDNILAFKEDIDKDGEYQIYNRSLSGWYVVTDMKISYNTVKNFKGKTYKKLQTQLILNRIEYKPTFKSDYDIAKKAIEKYRTENISANIMCSGDII